MANVVAAELRFDALSGVLVSWRHYPGVVDDNVKPVCQLCNL
jgi:hypothetical protein